MQKSISLNKFFSMENIFSINDTSLLEYLSNVCNLKYIIELQFIKRDDITKNYNNIFESIDKSTYDVKLLILLEKLKEEYDNSFKYLFDKVINYDQCHGC
jgi:hypothetical protein